MDCEQPPGPFLFRGIYQVKEKRMQITKRMTSVLIMISLLAFGLQAQNTESTTKVATTAAQFLKIGVGARSNAMGGAYVAMDYGIESIFWNPANIARISGMGEAAFNHSNWLLETQYDFAAFSLNTTMGTIGLHFACPKMKYAQCFYRKERGRFGMRTLLPWDCLMPVI